MNRHAKDNALWAGIAALLMLGYGWGVGFAVISDNTFYNTTVSIFNWMLKMGGIGMAIVAIVCFAGLRLGLLLDAFVSGICGLLMVLCAGTWLVAGGFGLNDVLVLIFGGVFLNAARGCWSSYNASASGDAGRASGGRGWFGIKPLEPPKPSPKPEPPHPASIRPKSLPKDGEPPPEGYLAALAKEDEEPPTASFE